MRFRAPGGVTFKTLATGGLTSYALSTAGQVYAWGGNSLGEVGNGRNAVGPVAGDGRHRRRRYFLHCVRCRHQRPGGP